MGSGWVVAGSLLALAGVAAGAFGAHALAGRLEPRALEVYEVGVRYHLYHALALVLVGLLAGPGRRLSSCGWSFVGGIFLFSGSLYALALTEWKALGAVTPVGGVAFLVGWALLGWSFKLRRRSAPGE